MANLKKISPSEAKALIEQGAVLVDIREGDERARVQIPGSEHLPLSKLGQTPKAPGEKGQVIVFHCKTGNRTAVNAAKLSDKSQCEAYILEGGIDAWAAAGLPTVAAEKKPPMEILRQVMIVAGSMALAGVVLGLNVDPTWFYLSGFVGLGLIFSGVTGYCLMAYILKLMPWNKGYA